MLTTDLDMILLLAEPEKPLRDLPGAEEAFRALEDAVRRQNERDHPGRELPLAVGDDGRVWGLFSRRDAVYDVLDEIREAGAPGVRFRFVVTRGKIARAAEDPRFVGGELVQRAEAALQTARKSGRRFTWRIGPSLLDDVLVGLLEAANQIIDEMTPYQREVWRLLRDGFNQRAIADRLEKFPQSVSDAIRRSGADTVIQTEETIRKTLAISLERWELIAEEVEAGR